MFFLLTVCAIIKQNYSHLGSLNLKSSLEILDSKTACSLFATFFGLLLVRHQFILGFKPRIVYECVKTTSAFHPELTGKGILWQVKIKNVGLGVSVFSSYKFKIGIESITEGEYQDFNTAIEDLKKNGFFPEEDFYLSNITSGGALPSKEDKIIFEILLPVGYKIKQIDLRMFFEGYLGGRYRKDVYLIPRLGIPNKEDNKNTPQETEDC